MRDRIKSSLTEFEGVTPSQSQSIPQGIKNQRARGNYYRSQGFGCPIDELSSLLIAPSSFVSNQMLYCFSLGYCIVYHVGVAIYIASIV